ncbi:MAG: BolA family protein [Wenzhouxiangellaceae bacterium]|nr:BolA family protein [Wenzhouxiangellaceae bacterium]
MDSDRIGQLLREAFPSGKVVVDSEDDVHFSAKIVDEGFEGLSRVARHRRVHDAIGPALGREIHALTMKLRTPDEDGGS